MIYKIKKYKNKLIEKAYRDGMKELNGFFGINWNFDTPNICVLNSRKEINFFGYKNKDWIIGFAQGRTIYLLDNDKMEKESCHKKHSTDEYSSLIKHELCHLFYNIISGEYYKPVWLTEGVSIYLSGQLKEKKPVEKFTKFLEFYGNGGSEVYSESGTAVKLLVEKFGKKKLLKLISRSKEASNKKEFAKLFKKIYGFDLGYKNFNILLSKC
jgi:hypothetical protein